MRPEQACRKAAREMRSEIPGCEKDAGKCVVLVLLLMLSLLRAVLSHSLCCLSLVL